MANLTLIKISPKYEQISLFDTIREDRMYDGYEVKNTVTIRLPIVGCNVRLIKGQQCYMLTEYKGRVHIDFPNEFGGAYGFSVTKSQFKAHFKNLSRKIYPRTNEIWNGKSWVKNPMYCQ